MVCVPEICILSPEFQAHILERNMVMVDPNSPFHLSELAEVVWMEPPIHVGGEAIQVREHGTLVDANEGEISSEICNVVGLDFDSHQLPTICDVVLQAHVRRIVNGEDT